jgi:hypothetical protein
VEAGGGDGEGGGGDGTWPHGVHFTSSFELVVRFFWSIKSPTAIVTVWNSNTIIKQHNLSVVVEWSVLIFFFFLKFVRTMRMMKFLKWNGVV